MKDEIKQQKGIPQKYVKALPEVLPKPTFMPFLLAFSLMLIGWGLLVNWIICAAGFLGTCISIYGWIKQLLNDNGQV